jgi:NADH dehydrogenase
MSKLVTIYGGSGFLGRDIVQHLAQQGWRIRVAVRRPNQALQIQTCGVVGQVEVLPCNIRDDDSVRAVMKNADVVVNCVGTFDRKGRNNFNAIQNEGAGRIARIAAEEGVTRMVHISALGADPESDSDYSRTKALGELAILASFPKAVILRPSVVFGTDDGFFNRFAAMSRITPVLPLVGAETRFQPVWVDDVAKAAAMGVEGQAEAGIYELGGPEIRTLRQLVKQMLKVIHRRRLILNIPFAIASMMGWMIELANTLTVGLFPKLLTRDQVKMLKVDNVVSEGARGFADLGITPVSAGVVIPSYLWRFRPKGQFEAIRDSASNLRP